MARHVDHLFLSEFLGEICRFSNGPLSAARKVVNLFLSGFSGRGRPRRVSFLFSAALLEDWDAFMELGDSAHVHARGPKGMRDAGCGRMGCPNGARERMRQGAFCKTSWNCWEIPTFRQTRFVSLKEGTLVVGKFSQAASSWRRSFQAWKLTGPSLDCRLPKPCPL